MNVVIRTDAGTELGSGHLMRCMALADALRQRGVRTTFLTRASIQPWAEMIAGRGHELIPLAGDPLDEAADAEITLTALGDVGDIEWMVVDHYGLGAQWEQAIRPRVRSLFAIDDLGREHVCDVLLDQNVLEKNARMQSSPCACLTGPRYALLRNEFATARRHLRVRDEACRQVLINFGGSDPTGETGKAIEGFLRAEAADMRACVVLGAANPASHEMHRRYDGHPRIDLIDRSDRMAHLMAEADLAIGAGGTSTWERACLGLPTIVVAVAPNQEAIADDLARRGSHCYLGRSRDVGGDDIARAIRFLAGNPGLRKAFSGTSAALCDGDGVRRVVAHMVGSATIAVRRVTSADADAILAWRNDEAVRRSSRDSSAIDRDRHEQWLAQVLGDPARALLIGEDASGPVGVVRFDVEGEEAEVSIYLVPGRRGDGLGGPLLAAAQAWLGERFPALSALRAKVLADNRRSAAMFEDAGYRQFECTFRKSLMNRGETA